MPAPPAAGSARRKSRRAPAVSNPHAGARRPAPRRAPAKLDRLKTRARSLGIALSHGGRKRTSEQLRAAIRYKERKKR